MAEVSDELLMAYADDAIDPATRTSIEAEIQRRPDYARKVEAFRATLNPIHDAFREEREAHHMRPLIDWIRRHEARPLIVATDPNAGSVFRFLGDDAARMHTRRLRQHFPTAMAASLALLIGAALSWSLDSGRMAPPQPSPSLVTLSDGGLLAQGALQELLEKRRSGALVAARSEGGKAWDLKASFTFRSTSQSPCRRYEISGATGSYAGYACRSEEGKWFIGAHANLDAKAPNTIGFAPAAGGGDAVVDAAIRSIMDGDVYQAKDEEELIAGRWSTIRK